MSFTGKPSLTGGATVANDGFWPDLTVGDLLNDYRIPPEYADNVILMGLVLAMVRVNEQLDKVKAQLELSGYADLAAYTSANPDDINGQPVLSIEYKNAVFCRAKAGLLQQFNSLNRKENAENAAKEAPETERYWLDRSQKSIKALFTEVLPDEIVLANANAHVALL